MKDAVVLPFEPSPAVRCYHNNAFPLGIIQGNAKVLNKDITPWIIGKYLNCVFNYDATDNRYEIDMTDWWGIDEKIVYHQCIDMRIDTLEKVGIDGINLIKQLLNENFYVSGMFNEKHIPGKASYKKWDYVHDFIVYGYDDNKEVYYSAGYLGNRKYSAFEIPYKNFVASLYDSPSPKIDYNIWTFNREFDFKVNVPRIFARFNDYYNSSNYYGMRPSGSYGIEGNRKLKEFVNERGSRPEKPWIDDRYTRGFMEHKNLSVMCIKYLQEHNIINLEDSYIQLSDMIQQKANSIYMMAIKHNIAPNRDLLKDMIDCFEYIEEAEQIVLPKVISALSNVL